MVNKKSQLDEMLYEFIRMNKGCATWGKLIDARKPPIGKSVLKAVIDRMVKNERMIIKAEKVNGKTTTLYCLSNRPTMEKAKDSNDKEAREDTKDFLQWVENFVAHIEKAYAKDISNNFTKSYADERGGPVKEHVILTETQHVQEYALSLLINFLGMEILDELGRYSQKETDVEAEQYIDAAIKTDFAVLIKNLAKLTSPRYGDTREVISSVKEHLSKIMPLTE